MNQSITEKMRAIASHVKELNANGKVRAMTGNEKGYAKILTINAGCRLWAHHTREDRLFIDVMITQSAAHRYRDDVNAAANAFTGLATGVGYKVRQREWRHAIESHDVRQQHYVDVTDKNIDDILRLIDKIKSALKPSK